MIPKKIWLYWENHDGTAKLPDYLALCLETIIKHSPGFEVNLINRDTARICAPNLQDNFNSPIYCNMFDGSKPSLPHKSDIFRSHVLALHGGIWLDIDAIAVSDLNVLIDLAGEAEVSCFAETYNMPETCCIVCKQGSNMIATWARRQDEFLATKPKEVSWLSLSADMFVSSAGATKYNQLDINRVRSFNWQETSKWFSNESLSQHMTNDKIFFMLYNAVVGKQLKYKVRDELLQDNNLLGRLFNFALV